MKSLDSLIKKYQWILLGGIIALGAILRLYALNSIPPGVNRDEASIGYTAYSLIKTGRDEYGKYLPLSFQSFGDWKLPLYIYTDIPFVKIFGATELAIRLPSALGGIIAIFITFLLVQELFQSYRLSLITSFFLAISPWHIHFSRVESESNVAVLFTSLGFLLFLKGLKKNIYLPLSAIFWGLPYFTYHGNHVTSSFLIVGLIIFYWKRIPKNRYSLASLLILIILPLIILSQTLSEADKTKLSGISIFGDPAVIHAKIEIPRNASRNPYSFLIRLRYNRVTFAIETIAINYFKSFGPQFLFIQGGTNHAHNIDNFGNLYLVEAPFFYLGMLIFFLRRKNLHFSFLLWWLLISPVAASVTKDAPHSNRMFAIYPLPPLLTALGIFWALEYFRKPKWIQRVIVVLVSIAFIGNLLIYLNRYFVEFPHNEAQYWGFGYQKLAKLLNEPNSQRKPVIMAHPEYSPYIYLILYTNYDPLVYQTTTVRYPPMEDGFIHVKSFDRFEFRELHWDIDSKKSNTLLIDYTQFLPESIKNGNFQKEEIFLPNGKSFLTIIKT